MQILQIPINVPINQLVSTEKLNDFCVEHIIPDKSRNVKAETTRLAAMLLRKTNRVALEVKIQGIQRDFRAPVAFTHKANLYILRVCNNKHRIENSLYVVSDLVSAAEQELGSRWQVYGLVLYPVQVSNSVKTLAEQLKVRIIYEESLLNGIFN